MKHLNILQQWLSGETIQVKIHGIWCTIGEAICYENVPPYFEESRELRIKPKTFTTTTYIQRKDTKDSSPLHLVDSYTEHPNIELTWEDNILISAKVL
jgi:hypothetical protein